MLSSFWYPTATIPFYSRNFPSPKRPWTNLGRLMENRFPVPKWRVVPRPDPTNCVAMQTSLAVLSVFFGRKNHHWFCLMVDSGFKPFQKYTRLNWIISPRVKNKKSLKEQPKWLLSCSKCWSYQFVIGLWTSRWALKPRGHFRQCKPWLQ